MLRPLGDCARRREEGGRAACVETDVNGRNASVTNGTATTNLRYCRFTVEAQVADRGGVVAVGLLTAADLERLGVGFKRVWPVEETPCFNELLLAIDEADRAIRQELPGSPIRG
jgi:hypothetical protein